MSTEEDYISFQKDPFEFYRTHLKKSKFTISSEEITDILTILDSGGNRKNKYNSFYFL